MFYHRNGRRILDHTRCKAEAEAICASQAGDNLAEQRVVQLSAPVKIGLEESLTIIISVRAAAARSSARRAAWRCPSPSSSSCRTPASPSPAAWSAARSADPGRSGARPQPSLAVSSWTNHRSVLRICWPITCQYYLPRQRLPLLRQLGHSLGLPGSPRCQPPACSASPRSPRSLRTTAGRTRTNLSTEKYNHFKPELNNNLLLTIKHWTVLADVEPLEKLGVLAHVIRPDGAQELDVVVAVELGHLPLNTNNMLRTISQRSK